MLTCLALLLSPLSSRSCVGCFASIALCSRLVLALRCLPPPKRLPAWHLRVCAVPLLPYWNSPPYNQARIRGLQFLNHPFSSEWSARFSISKNSLFSHWSRIVLLAVLTGPLAVVAMAVGVVTGPVLPAANGGVPKVDTGPLAAPLLMAATQPPPPLLPPTTVHPQLMLPSRHTPVMTRAAMDTPPPLMEPLRQLLELRRLMITRRISSRRLLRRLRVSMITASSMHRGMVSRVTIRHRQTLLAKDTTSSLQRTGAQPLLLPGMIIAKGGHRQLRPHSRH